MQLDCPQCQARGICQNEEQEGHWEAACEADDGELEEPIIQPFTSHIDENAEVIRGEITLDQQNSTLR